MSILSDENCMSVVRSARRMANGVSICLESADMLLLTSVQVCLKLAGEPGWVRNLYSNTCELNRLWRSGWSACVEGALNLHLRDLYSSSSSTYITFTSVERGHSAFLIHVGQQKTCKWSHTWGGFFMDSLNVGGSNFALMHMVILWHITLCTAYFVPRSLGFCIQFPVQMNCKTQV